MDVTVDLLVEVDKLIQLLESPIFICKHKRNELKPMKWHVNVFLQTYEWSFWKNQLINIWFKHFTGS